jgi:hypothetical protein
MVSSQIRKRFLNIAVATFVLILFPTVSGRGETVPAGIQVEMDHRKPLWLHITLRSFAEARATVYKSVLPWGSSYSIILVAATSDGQCLDRNLPVDDPSPEQVSLDPKGSLSGDINLRNIFPNLDRASKRSAVHLFWAYEAPEELRIGH